MISILILTSYIVSQISIIILHNSRLSFFLIFRISYRKNPKILDTQKFAVITLKVEQVVFSLE